MGKFFNKLHVKTLVFSEVNHVYRSEICKLRSCHSVVKKSLRLRFYCYLSGMSSSCLPKWTPRLLARYAYLIFLSKSEVRCVPTTEWTSVSNSRVMEHLTWQVDLKSERTVMMKITTYWALNNVSGIVFHALSTFSHLIFTTFVVIILPARAWGSEIQQLAQRHGAGKWQSWNSNLSLSDTKTWTLRYWIVLSLKAKFTTKLQYT